LVRWDVDSVTPDTDAPIPPANRRGERRLPGEAATRLLGFGKVQEIAQDEHRALARGQCRECAKQLVVRVDRDRVGGVVGALGRRVAGQLEAVPGSALRAVECEIDEDPAGVRDGVLGAADPWPALGHFQKGLLHEVLCVGEIPHDQVCRPQQPIGVLADEAVEVCAARIHLTP
jgi:hypothetical protein